ncbi:hypothetical protein WCLE_002430 [Wolbachia endosymbiont of Cimex lectularius]|nr:hypothetical protein WCLE_002430 [Wolbachia endosymbiont of Cimex lectularius]
MQENFLIYHWDLVLEGINNYTQFLANIQSFCA